MAAPEINVRLTADGVQDVVNAFKRVQQETKATREQAALTGQVMQQLGELMPVVTIGAAVTKLVELGKSALDSAVSIGKLAQETGASAGTLSVLVMAAHDVGVSQDDMGKALVRLSRNMENASNGSAASKKAFDSLGISMADIKSKNPADLFVEIAQKLQAMPDGATKSAVAMQLFGRTGAQLIPLLNEIGSNGGFDDLKTKAEKLGLYLSDDFVAQAKKGEEELRNMQDITHGFAMQFMTGFLPEMTKGMEDFNTTVSGGGAEAFKSFGDLVGNVVRGVVNVFLVASQTIAVLFTSLWDGVKNQAIATFDAIGTASKGTLTAMLQASMGDFSGAVNTIKRSYSSASSGYSTAQKDAFSRQGAIWSAYGSQVKSEYSNASSAPGLSKPTGGGTGGSGDGSTAAEKDKALKEYQKLVDARAAYEDAVANGELQKEKARDQQKEADDKAAFDAGLKTLDEYYNARADRINTEAAAEKTILEGKLATEESAAAQLMGKTQDFVDNLIGQGSDAVEQAAGKNVAALAMLQRVAATKAQIDADELKRQTDIANNETARHQAATQATQKMLSDRERLYALEGNTSAAQQMALERELAETDELLTRLGVAENDRKAILSRAGANATAKSTIGALSQSGSDAFASMDTAVSAIQDKASAGTISELDATAQIYKLEQQRLPALQQIAQQMQDVVYMNEMELLPLQEGTDEYNAQLQVVNNLQKTVDDFTKKVTTLGTSLQTTKSFSVELSNQLAQQGTGIFVNFFDAINTGTKSASDAFASLGKDFEAMITHMIDQMIMYYALSALVGWLAPKSSLATSLGKAGPFGSLTGHAAGGYTGNVAPNKVAGLVHGQEYVFTAAATKKWGLPMLEAMNAGVSGVSTSSSASGISSASAGSGDGGPLVELNIDTGGQPAQTSQRQGPNGTSIIDLVIGQVASDIAGGGKVGQSIQSTFGVSRKGNRRG